MELRILEILKEKGSATVGLLAKELFVSLPTIRSAPRLFMTLRS